MSMTKEQAERFEKWYRFIKNRVKDYQFAMNSYCDGNPNDLLKKDKCGTTGCLAGYLPAIFEEWCYPSESSDRPCLISSLVKEVEEEHKTIGLKPVVQQCVHIDEYVKEKVLFDDLVKFFGIKNKDIRRLIVPPELDSWDDDYPDRKEMLERMKKLADDYGWEIS